MTNDSGQTNRRRLINYAIAISITALVVGFSTYLAGQIGTPQQTTTTTTTVTIYESTISLTEGQKDGPLLVEQIYPDHITGLRFIEYPVANDKGTPITLRIGESVNNGCNITLTLINIQDKTATFSKKVEPNKICPICLSETTLIDTPNGPINIKELKKGMTVWTADTSGSRREAQILETVNMQAPKDHRIVHLIFSDGREIFGSPNHPLTDGRTLADISPGDIIGDGYVIKTELVPYQGKTYDILPSGETGSYWANGILLKSTITIVS